MSSAPHPSPGLLTAEEFARRPNPGHPEELHRGRIEIMPPPGARHGKICARLSFLLQLHLQVEDLGHVLTNDAGVVTERGPDSVRGPDIAFYSYARLPRGPLPEGYPDSPPDVAFEVMSPSDRWPRMLAKVAEYLNAGVAAVVVLDPERSNLHLYHGDQPVRILADGDELAIPEILGGFRVPIRRFFE